MMIEATLKTAMEGAAVLSGRIYPLRTPEDAILPCAVYLQESDEAVLTLTGPTGLSMAVYQVFVLADSYRTLALATAQIRAALDGAEDERIGSVITSEETPEKYEDEAGVLRAEVIATVYYYNN